MEDTLSMRNRVALVTGAGSGIGRSTAKLLAEHGAAVTILSRNEQELESLRQEITSLDKKALVVKADVSDSDAMCKACEQTIKEFGKLDTVIANAGVNGVWAPIDKILPEDFLRTVQINLVGTFVTIHSATPYLKKQGGSIVITSSINGNRKFTSPGSVAYSASKAGQVTIAKMLAVELGPHKIRINVVCPGSIATDIEQNTKREDTEHLIPLVEFPEGKIPLTGSKPGSAAQVAQLMLFLSSDASSHITGTEVFIDGGQSLLQ
jgi:NAD(P)-dependent dehydrogenase (short-subunit alcohol dehydrogenase family)